MAVAREFFYSSVEGQLKQALWRWEMRWSGRKGEAENPKNHRPLLEELLRLKTLFAEMQGYDELARVVRETQEKVARKLIQRARKNPPKALHTEEPTRKEKGKKKQHRKSRKPKGELMRRPVYIHF